MYCLCNGETRILLWKFLGENNFCWTIWLLIHAKISYSFQYNPRIHLIRQQSSVFPTSGLGMELGNVKQISATVYFSYKSLKTNNHKLLWMCQPLNCHSLFLSSSCHAILAYDAPTRTLQTASKASLLQRSSSYPIIIRFLLTIMLLSYKAKSP